MNTSIKEELKAIIEAFKTTPTKNQTLEMCEAAVEHDGLNIKKVSKRLISKELCIKAINNNADAFFLLGKEFICKETIMAFIENHKCKRNAWGEVLKKIGRLKGVEIKDVVDEELAKFVISIDGSRIKADSFSRFANNLDIIAAGLESYGDNLIRIPKEEIQKEHVLKAIKGNVAFNHIPSEFMEDDDVLDALCNVDSDYLRWIPKEKLNYKRCLSAVKTGTCLSEISSEYLTQELVDAAIEKSVWNAEHAPLEFLTRELLLKVCEKSEYALKGIKVEAVDEEIAYELVLKGASIKRRCIYENQSQRIVELAFHNDHQEILHAKKEFFHDELVDEIISKAPKLIDAIPLKFINEERIKAAVEGGADLKSETIRNNQTKEVIDLLFQNNYFTDFLFRSGMEEKLEFVKEEFKTKEFFKKFVSGFSRAIEFVPSEIVDEEICYLAACAGADIADDFLQKYQTQRIVDAAWKYGDNHQLRYVKDEFKTVEIIEKSIEADISDVFSIPDDKMKEEYLYKHVCKTQNLFGKFKNNQSRRIADKAFELKKDNFPYIRDDLKTKEMCEEAFQHDAEMVLYIPEEFTTEGMWIEGIKKAYDYKLGFFISRMPEKFRTDRMYIEVIKRDWSLLRKIPKEYLTLELQMAAFEIDEKSLVYFDM